MVLGEGRFGDVEDVGGVGLRGQWRLLGLGSRRRNERRRGKTGRLNTTSQGRAAEAVGTEWTAASVRLVRGTGRGAGRRGESHIQPRCLEQQEHSDAEHDDRLHAGHMIAVLINACKPFHAGRPSPRYLHDSGGLQRNREQGRASAFQGASDESLTPSVAWEDESNRVRAPSLPGEHPESAGCPDSPTSTPAGRARPDRSSPGRTPASISGRGRGGRSDYDVRMISPGPKGRYFDCVSDGGAQTDAPRGRSIRA